MSTEKEREKNRRAVAKHRAKASEEETKAVSKAVESREQIDLEDFDVMTEALDALSTVKAAITVAPPGSVAGLATTQLKLAVEIDKYRRELEQQKKEEAEKEDSVFDD